MIVVISIIVDIVNSYCCSCSAQFSVAVVYEVVTNSSIIHFNRLWEECPRQIDNTVTRLLVQP